RHQLLAAREGEQLPRQPFAAASGAADRLDRLCVLGVLELARENLRVTGNDHQQVVEVVRNAARKLPERFHLLRLRESLTRLLEHDLLLVLRSNIVYELGKA